ncbi:hypothetical protein EVG20_g7172 [Dentipellis fragilis]|uniref:Uncharacterized protein n=1 Tax=Dentipellis fragilis TaxID=205917 RepID=A0A4Y9YFJ7_9AGAM|nr:hypothetical protein EVG20_g7172 [Dentipellis fragilis]
MDGSKLDSKVCCAGGSICVYLRAVFGDTPLRPFTPSPRLITQYHPHSLSPPPPSRQTPTTTTNTMHYLQSFVRTTDTANYLQSIVRADSSKVKSFFALGDSTNTQRSKGTAPPTKTKTKQYPRFDSKKAAATVALSSASASPSSTSSQSAIPFPCAPEDVISAYDDLDPFAAALEDIDVVPAARAKRACPAEGRRRRCQTPLHTPGKHHPRAFWGHVHVRTLAFATVHNPVPFIPRPFCPPKS